MVSVFQDGMFWRTELRRGGGKGLQLSPTSTIPMPLLNTYLELSIKIHEKHVTNQMY